MTVAEPWRLHAAMVSRKSLTLQVKAFDAVGVLAGLEVRPDLLGVRDDKGRSWLHLIAAQPAGGDDAKTAASIVLAEGLIARGLDMNDAAFTEGPNGKKDSAYRVLASAFA